MRESVHLTHTGPVPVGLGANMRLACVMAAPLGNPAVPDVLEQLRGVSGPDGEHRTHAAGVWAAVSAYRWLALQGGVCGRLPG